MLSRGVWSAVLLLLRGYAYPMLRCPSLGPSFLTPGCVLPQARWVLDCDGLAWPWVWCMLERPLQLVPPKAYCLLESSLEGGSQIMGHLRRQDQHEVQGV